jgi:hypothetical protein
VIVKVRRPRRGLLRDVDTGLAPVVEDERKLDCEYNALAWIQRHLEPLDDERFGAVRVLDLLPEHRAFVMEAAPAQNLGAALDPVLRGRNAQLSGSLCAAARNSGVWLAAYHPLASPPQTRDEPHTSEAFVASLRRLLEGVALDRGSRIDPRAVERQLVDQARNVLPAELPMGLGHGDYRPGNVLTDAAGRVFVIDTFATWRGPIYGDISHYLFSLKATRRQLYSPASQRWPAALEVIEREFLAGYFAGKPAPIAAVRLFEIQHLLYRWSRAARAAHWPGLAGLGKRARLTVKTRFFRGLLDRLLCDLAAPELPTTMEHPST